MSPSARQENRCRQMKPRYEVCTYQVQVIKMKNRSQGICFLKPPADSRALEQRQVAGVVCSYPAIDG